MRPLSDKAWCMEESCLNLLFGLKYQKKVELAPLIYCNSQKPSRGYILCGATCSMEIYYLNK